MRRSLQFGLSVAFLTSGLCTPLVAALSPWLVSRDHLSNREVGLYFAVQFFCSFFSSAIAARAPLRSLRVGLVALSAGTALLAVTSATAALVGAGLIGLGVGFVNTSGNTIRAYMPQAATGLLSINLMWSVGTVLSTLVLRDLSGNIKFILGSCALLALLQISLWLQSITPLIQPRTGSSRSLRYEVLFACALFLYVGAENGIALWTKLLFRDADPRFAGYGLMAFMVAMLLGRLFSPLLIENTAIKPQMLLSVSLVSGAACALMVALTASPLLRVAAIAISGFIIAPVFPLVVFAFARKLPPQRAWGYCACGLGASAVPYLMGALSMRFGLAPTYMIPGAALLLVALTVWVANAQSDTVPLEASDPAVVSR